MEGRLFKKTVGAAIANNAIPTAYDVITVAHKNNDIMADGSGNQVSSGGTLGNAVNRYLAYSNVDNTPEIAAFDAFNKPAKAAYSTVRWFLTITLADGYIACSS